MADFEALIKASITNLKSVQDDINSLSDIPVNLNVVVDAKSIKNQIENEINRGKYNLKINPMDTGGFQRQAQKSGSIAGQTFSKTFQRSLSVQRSLDTAFRKYEKLGGDNNPILGGAKSYISNARKLQKEMESLTGDDYSRKFIEFSNTISSANSEFTKVTDSAKTYQKAMNAIKFGDIQTESSIALREIEKYENSIQKAAAIKKNDVFLEGVIGNLSEDIKTIRSAQKELIDGASLDTILDQYPKYEAALRRVNNSFKLIKSSGKGTISEFDIDSAISDMSVWLEKNSKAVKDYGGHIDNLKARLEKLRKEIDKPWAQTELDDILGEFSQKKSEAFLGGKTGKTWLDSLGGAFESISRYVSVAEMIDLAVEAVREMYQNVVEIDTAMTELKKVTDETDASYEKFLDNAGSKAVKLGTTVSGLIESTAGFARMNFSMEDSTALAEVANIYAVVGDEVNGVENATNSIISTMTAFGVETEDALSIVDKFNRIGNEYQITSGGIGDALQRSASSLAASNNTLDESIALIAAANTVVNDPTSVGTAFKTKFLTDCLYVQKCA